MNSTIEVGTWGWVWIIWAAGALASFLIIELTAVFTNHMERTLSEELRRWLGIYPVRPWRKLGGVLFASLLLAAVGVFIWHILVR